MWLKASSRGVSIPKRDMLLMRGRPRVVAVAVVGLAALLATACTSGGDGDGSPSADTTVSDDGRPPVEGWSTDWSNNTVPLSELTLGIPRSDPRDAIPPIDDPAFETVEEADWLADREPVVVLELDGEARAYPLRILTSHEIVNDEVAGRPVAVTYCPLCNSAVSFDRRVDGETLRFGVSGLLRNSDLVMWDDRTESLWQQITGEAIVGQLAGEQLELIAAPLMPWQSFRESFPQGRVLSRDQGIYPAGLYDNQPYEGYDTSDGPFLYNDEPDERYPAMERVVALRVDGLSKAYPFIEISDERSVNDEVAGTPVLVVYGADDTASILDSGDVTQGRGVGVGLAFEREVEGQVLTFESLGDDRFEDRETGTVWDLFGNGLEGPLAGTELTPLVSTNELWFAWAAFNQGSPVYAAAVPEPDGY